MKLPWLLFAVLLLGTGSSLARGQVAFPVGDQNEPVKISANDAHRWWEGSYEVWQLSGNCRIQQGQVVARSDEAVLWIDRADGSSLSPHKVVAHMEGRVLVDYGPPQRTTGRPKNNAPNSLALTQPLPEGEEFTKGDRITGRTWLGRFYSRSGIHMRLPVPRDKPQVLPDIYHRGVAAWAPDGRRPVRLAQFTLPTPQPEVVQGIPEGSRRIRIRGRGSLGIQVRWFPVPERNEWAAAVSGGVNLLVEGMQELGTIDVSTDRLVIWTQAARAPDLSGAALQRTDTPLEIYMEGNIVFRQGDRVIYARSMYYNITEQYGIVLDGEMLTPVPEYQGLLRLRADVLQQLDRHNFVASGAALTTSRLGYPRYWFEADQMTFRDFQAPRINPFNGQLEVDPATGQPVIDHQYQATARNVFVHAGGVPVFYWPVIATDASKKTFYIDSIKIKNDSIFGAQLLTDWDVYQLLGWENPPQGTDWTAALDLMSERGVGFGTDFTYDFLDPFGATGEHRGELHAWGIRDHGLDNLGLDRRAVPPEKEFRGRVLWQHRTRMAGGYQLTGELGLISDRNFLESFYENEWDEFKDQSTDVELKRTWQNQSAALFAGARVNDFFTVTQWLPRGDHFLIGQSVFNDLFTWHAHSHAGYANLETTSFPTNPVDAAKYTPLAWEPRVGNLPSNVEGVRAGTRQELDLPLQVGPVKVVPYVLGDVTYWEEDLNGNSDARVVGQIGIRNSVSVWRADPTVQRPLLNLNGLAHKVTFESELLFAESNKDLGDLPLYDQLDDNAQEAFRRRAIFNTFGGTQGSFIPLKYDERYFALRSGMQSDVTAHSMEIADDLMLVNLGVRQRWQTKRGLPGRERTVDWITLDVGSTIFPRPDENNFGTVAGMMNYDLRWHVGDRFTVLSDGYFDPFPDGLRTASIGGFLTKPQVGTLYAGIRSAAGPFSSNVLASSATYRLSEKWLANVAAAYDLGPTGDIGSSVSMTRIGESFLVTFGVDNDHSRDNISARIVIEPRILSSRRTRIAGEPLPPVGAFGLE